MQGSALFAMEVCGIGVAAPETCNSVVRVTGHGSYIGGDLKLLSRYFHFLKGDGIISPYYSFRSFGGLVCPVPLCKLKEIFYNILSTID